MSEKPIGIFDSGVGGLTVLKALREALPRESFVYLGDTARLPYGNKSASTILRYTEECCTFLAGQNVKAIVIACNSASAQAFPYITHRFHFPVLGVVEAGVEAAMKATRNKKIGVIGTKATIASEIYSRELKKRDGDVKVTSIATPLFVSLVEEGLTAGPIAEKIAAHYLRPLPEMDTLILGCTHYPLLKETIQKTVGSQISLVDSAESMAVKLVSVLKEKALLYEGEKESSLVCYSSDMPQSFGALATQILGVDCGEIRKAELV